MKERATVVCWQRGRVLLVERGRARWALPGGTIRRGEAAADAARRELSEETTLEGCELGYLFQFGGLNKRHHVFLSLLPDEARPVPGNEILRCRWFRRGLLHSSLCWLFLRSTGVVPGASRTLHSVTLRCGP
ncbi:NUDIX domain-containing protein [Paraburkholderia guartelaensis]|uniref:NUDIX domain-containing protein n=1 Tax=Paraburkholderia guartelaensis TaxID=2546446 RepID=UPI002AB621E5|nr:NUDIX domain-containing protein [Paraburkholderia guartelaensis]